MNTTPKKFQLCWRYNKDIWGNISAKHKIASFARSKIKLSDYGIGPKLKNRRLLYNLTERISSKNINLLNFSFEIIWRVRKKRPKPMKSRMRLFFLTKILRLFYGKFTKKWFIGLCNLCLSKKTRSFRYFLKIFELRLPMLLYRIGLANSLPLAIDWVKSNRILLNNRVITSERTSLKLYDCLSFEPTLWPQVSENYIKLLYYGSKSSESLRCYTYNFTRKITRAHFIGIPQYLYFDTKTLSLYYWKNARPENFKFYFSLNLSNILKYTTI